MRILGCDPGLGGALALLDTSDGSLTIEDMPTATVQVGKSAKNQLIEAELARLIRGLEPDVAYVEAVHSMPRQGIASTFSFGVSYGVLRGVLATIGVPWTLVTPQEWGRLVRLPKGEDAARQRVLQLYPQHSALFARKRDHDRADALLLAHAGAMMMAATLPGRHGPESPLIHQMG